MPVAYTCKSVELTGGGGCLSVSIRLSVIAIVCFGSCNIMIEQELITFQSITVIGYYKKKQVNHVASF